MKDYLNREDDKKMIIKIISSSHDNNQNLSFAINGNWGAGKSYFLKMIIEELKNDHYVFYYDSWDNDYYDDPLIGMLDCLKDELNRINRDKNALSSVAKNVLKRVINVITSFVDDVAKSKVGFKPFNSFGKARKFINDCYQDGEISSDFNEKDKIKLAKHLIICSLNKLSDVLPIVFVVDELDRCLPTYALKIIERIHHISEHVKKCTTIFAVDTQQLEKIIDTLYRFDNKSFNAKGYLRKIIDFTYDLGNGTINDEFNECLNKYKSKFGKPTTWINTKEIDLFVATLFKNIEMRNIEKIINNAMSIHELLSLEKPPELDLLCLELFIAWAIGKYGNNYIGEIAKLIKGGTDGKEPIIKYLKTRSDNYLVFYYDKNYEQNYVSVLDLKSLIVYYVLKENDGYYPSIVNHRSIPQYFYSVPEDFSKLIRRVQF